MGEPVNIPVKIILDDSTRLKMLEDNVAALRDRNDSSMEMIGHLRGDNMLLREYANILLNQQSPLCRYREILGKYHRLRVSLYGFEIAPFKSAYMVVSDKQSLHLQRHFLNLYMWEDFKRDCVYGLMPSDLVKAYWKFEGFWYSYALMGAK